MQRYQSAAQRWAMLLVEPLVSLAQRQRIEDDFRDAARSEPDWWTVYVAGVLADIVQTLPVDDAWRTLVLGDDGAADWPLGDDFPTFGTWESVTDVIEPTSDAPRLDPSFVALEVPVPPRSTGLIQVAFQGWQALVGPVRQLVLQAGIDEAFDVGTAAIRFAQHRRRSYGLPADDIWAVVSGFTWAWRARWVVVGRQIDEDQIQLSIRQEQIRPKSPGR